MKKLFLFVGVAISIYVAANYSGVYSPLIDVSNTHNGNNSSGKENEATPTPKGAPILLPKPNSPGSPNNSSNSGGSSGQSGSASQQSGSSDATSDPNSSEKSSDTTQPTCLTDPSNTTLSCPEPEPQPEPAPPPPPPSPEPEFLPQMQQSQTEAQ
jgi:hypothetical protein